MIYKSIFSLLILLLSASCIHRPLNNLPSDLQSKPLSADEIKDGDKATMQIMIVYGGISCSHTTLRLYSPEKGSLFWDPGGGYATHKVAKVRRYNDVIKDQVPGIVQYINWRNKLNFATDAIEIFVFELDDQLALSLWQILDRGSVPKAHPKHPFKTSTVGSFCAHAVSNFLARFCADIVPVKQRFFPHSLAAQLYQKPIHQLIIYQDGEYKQFFKP